MKKVMLIGDSIRLGCQAKVTALLADTAVVTGPQDNCRFSAYTLFYLSAWVPQDDYDVIQWNNGQWDTCYMPDGKIHTPLSDYLALQERIASTLRKKTKRLIYATTTPVWPEMMTAGKNNPRNNTDITAYNKAASDRLLSLNMGIEINDLFTPIAADIKRHISADMVHLTEEGNTLCAGLIAAKVKG